MISFRAIRQPSDAAPRVRGAPGGACLVTKLIGIGLLTFLIGFGGEAVAGPPKRRPFLRGMALGHYSDIRNKVLQRKLDELRDLGVSHISLVVSWSMQQVSSTRIGPRLGYVTPDNVLVRIMRAARARGFKVFLFPILDVVERKMGQWRGTIRPGDWNVWWRNYSQFILHYAALAKRERADLFCVGSELVSTERMRGRWTNLISRVRKIYSGELVYSANWDHYEPVSFWDLVDRVGLTGYYKVAAGKRDSERQMLAAWKRIRGKLVRWSRKLGRPFFFTELGYPSLDGGAETPWNYTLARKPDPEEQRRAYSAFVRAWRGVPELGGVVFWDWYGDGGPKCTRYTPRGKPAAKVIRRWFRSRGPLAGGGDQGP
jgi:hypothetical protein